MVEKRVKFRELIACNFANSFLNSSAIYSADLKDQYDRCLTQTVALIRFENESSCEACCGDRAGDGKQSYERIAGGKGFVLYNDGGAAS